MLKYLRFLFVLFLFNSLIASGQTIDPASVDASTFSEVQIQRLASEMQKRGLNIEQALALARAQGVSEDQISILRQRLMSVSSLSDPRSTDFSMDGMDFEFDFVEDPIYSTKAFFIATEEQESMFGFHFFNSEDLTFQPGVNYPVTPSYLLGPGDQFIIDVYGASEMTYMLYIDKNGNITIPNVGPIAVGGYTLDEAEKKIETALARIYREIRADNQRTFVNIQIAAIKPITVNVIGEVFMPGTFTLPGTSTAFNALYLAGGPNLRGTFRAIQVIRNGELLKTLDVYDYLLNGNSKVNIALKDGDIIIVPTYRNRVRIGGNFIRTGIFETLEGESLEKLIGYAGGFNDVAYTRRIELHRNTGREKEMKDIYIPDYDKFTTQNGDSLYSGKILDRFTNRVAINGAVFRPGTFELSPGLTLKELIEKADGIREDAFMERGMILRLNEDLSPKNVSFSVKEVIEGRFNTELKREDVVTISSVNQMKEERTIHIFGEVQHPGRFTFRDQMTLGDLIALSGGLKESASESYVEVTRRLSYDEVALATDKTAHLFQFTIPRSLTLENKDAAFELKAFDQIFIRRAPGFKEEMSVMILGEVMYAGEYSLIGRNERLSDVIKRAGGLNPEAFPSGAMLTREKKQTAKARRLAEALAESEDGLSFNERDFDVIGIDLVAALKNPGSRDDIFLQEGDELIIPRRLQTVQVEGEVLNPISMPYLEGKGLKYYINQSGGFALRAKKRKAYVIYPNGTAAATKNFLFLSSYPKVIPGSQVVIPRKPDKTPIPATGWIAIGSGVSSLTLTIVTVINQIKK